MTLPDEAMEKLRELSAKAVGGEWIPYYALKYASLKGANGVYIAEPLPRAPWRNHADVEFIAALVNWFRANEAALASSERKDVKYVWSVENKTSCAFFSSEEAAAQYISHFPGSIAGGMHMSKHVVFDAAMKGPTDDK